MIVTHFRILLVFFLAFLMACQPSPPQLETDLADLVQTATKNTNRLDTLQQRIKVNQASLDFTLQQVMAENQISQAETVKVNPLAQLPDEQKAQIQLQASNLLNEWENYMKANNDLLDALSSTINQIVRLKNQMDQSSIKIRPDVLDVLSVSMLELEENLNQLDGATLDCHSRSQIFLSENPVLANRANILQSHTPEQQH